MCLRATVHFDKPGTIIDIYRLEQPCTAMNDKSTDYKSISLTSQSCHAD